MVCPFCGQELHGDEIFCADCSASLGIATAVAERPVSLPAVPARHRPGPSDRRKKPKKTLLYLLTALCALSLSALALLAGAYYDTADPLGLQDVFWSEDGAYAVPPKPGAPFDPDAPISGLTPVVTPVSRGEPVGNDHDNVIRLLRAAISLAPGLVPESPLNDEQLSIFLWQALFYAVPDGRFDQTPDGYFIPFPDLDDLFREALGFAPDILPPGLFSLTAADGGYLWLDDFTDGWRIDIFEWSNAPDGSVRVRFNALNSGMLYDSFYRQGEVRLVPNEDPVYYRYHLDLLRWDDSTRFIPSRISASSSLRVQGGEAYMPDKLIDGSPATAWVAGAAGDGAGEWLELAFDAPREITGLTIVNGYCKDLASMRQNTRVKSFRVTCDGYSREFELEDVPDYYTGGDFQSITFGQAIQTDKITFAILSVYQGTSGTRVSLSEIWLF